MKTIHPYEITEIMQITEQLKKADKTRKINLIDRLEQIMRNVLKRRMLKQNY